MTQHFMHLITYKENRLCQVEGRKHAVCINKTKLVALVQLLIQKARALCTEQYGHFICLRYADHFTQHIFQRKQVIS